MSNPSELETLRRQIDEIDADLLALVNRRVRLAQAVGRKKAKGEDKVVYRPEREALILDRIVKLNKGPLTSEKIEWLFREVISLCRAAEAKPLVAALGPAGTYSELAAVRHFGRAPRSAPSLSGPALASALRLLVSSASSSLLVNHSCFFFTAQRPQRLKQVK